jgi:hypothetical protein
MTAKRRYAEGTSVSVDSSRGEITGILTKHGVKKMGWMSDGVSDQLVFEIDGHNFRFTMEMPTLEWAKREYPNAYDWGAKVQAEWRRRWRANVLLLKAKLEFIDSGDSTLTRELLPYMVTKNGKTIEELMAIGGLPLLTEGK